MRVSPPITNFTAGEWSRLMDGQVTLAQRSSACRTVENFIILTQGAAAKTPGTYFIAEVKDSAKAVRLIPFQFSTTQAYAIEMGDLYARYFKDKGQIMAGGAPYETGSPYTLADLGNVRSCQDKDLMYLFHNNYPIHKLTRLGHDNWLFENAAIMGGPFLPRQSSGETGTNLAINGDFEENTGITSILTPLVQRRTNDRFYSKNYARTFTADAAGEGFSAEFGSSTITGKNYVVRFRVSTKAIKLRLKVKCGGSSTYNHSSIIDGVPQTSWMEYERYFTEGAGGANPAIEFLSEDGELLDSEMVANGGFELDSDWVKFGNADGSVNRRMLGDGSIPAKSGQWYWFFRSNGTDLWGIRSGSFFTETGNVYKIEYWARGDAPSPTLTVQMRRGNNSGVFVIADEAAVTPGVWTKYTHYYEETNGGAWGHIAFGTKYTGSVRIDDITVKEVKSQYYIDKLEIYEVGSLMMTPGAVSGNGVSLTASANYFELGHIGSLMQITHGETSGVVRVVGVSSPTAAAVDVITELGNTTATASWSEGAWSNKNGYPSCGAFYEQRLCAANTKNDPDGLWGSRTTEYDNFTPGTNPTDAIAYKLQADIIRWLAPLGQLVAGTVNSEQRVGANRSDQALTPANIKMTAQGRKGSANSEALPIGNSIVFVQKRGSAQYGNRLRELFYNYEVDAYKSIDLTAFADHISGGGFVRLAYMSSPYEIIWAVTVDGALIGLTHDKDHQVFAWHRHTLGGGFVEDLCVIPGANQDELWLIVRRTINGVEKRFIEVMADFDFGDDPKDAFYVACGLTYDGLATSTITGLGHLEGKTVEVFADGAVHGTKVVSSGSITLDAPASVVHVGLPYVSTLEPLDLQGGSMEGTSAGKNKRIHGVAVYFHKTLGGYIGPDSDHLEPLIFRDTGDLVGSPVPLFTGLKDDFNFPGDWGLEAKIMIRHSDPLPCTVLSILPRFRTEDR